MRHKGSRNEYSEERDRDLLAVFRRTIEGCKHINLYEVANKVVNSPAPRFYVSEYRARNVIKRMFNGKPLHKISPLRMEMYEEIFARVKEARKVMQHKPLLLVIEEVLSQPAPKFYLTEKSGVVILHKIQKRLRCRERGLEPPFCYM